MIRTRFSLHWCLSRDELFEYLLIECIHVVVLATGNNSLVTYTCGALAVQSSGLVKLNETSGSLGECETTLGAVAEVGLTRK